MNTRVASLHHSTPFSLFYGRSFAGLTDFSSAESHLLSEEELQNRLEYLTALVFPAIDDKSSDTQKRMVEKFNRTHKILQFPPGAFVMAKEELPNGKLAPKYQGPYKVVARTENGAYTLLDATNQKLARNYAPSQLKMVTQALDAPSEESYEIESIVDHELTGKGMMYTVKWKGYDSSYNEQIPYENFDSDIIIRQYWKNLRQQNPHINDRKRKKQQKNNASESTRLLKRKQRQLTHNQTKRHKRHVAAKL
ncbi:hypothetical protein BX616_008124 [Lobosporangium transversale]|nr:hypothetical protein BX616_008124 [Lobosporangium transversale]